jgi:DivIVA domain-containing protein
MAKDTNLTAQEIYEKEFHVDLKGYAPAEVDEFLDQVIEDYQNYDEKVEEMGAAIARYEEKIKELQQQIISLQSENENLNEKVSSDFVNGNSSTVDILKRIARLEKAVFNQSEDEE